MRVSALQVCPEFRKQPLTVLFTAPVAAQPGRDTFKDDPASGEEVGGCTQAGVGQAFLFRNLAHDDAAHGPLS